MVTITMNDDEARDLKLALGMSITVPEKLREYRNSLDTCVRVGATMDRLYEQLEGLLDPEQAPLF